MLCTFLSQELLAPQYWQVFCQAEPPRQVDLMTSMEIYPVFRLGNFGRCVKSLA